jgi:hypothetical protein
MVNDDLEEMFRELSVLLHKCNLDWVVESVEADISAGKEITVREHIMTRPTQDDDDEATVAASRVRRVRAAIRSQKRP